MSQIIPIEEAASRLLELVRDLAPGDEILLMDQHKIIASIQHKPSGEAIDSQGRRVPGAGKGMIEIVGDLNDDTEVHEMFKEYME